MDAKISGNEMRIVFRGSKASVSLRLDAVSEALGNESIDLTVTVSGAPDMPAAKLFKAAITRAEDLLRQTHIE